jgi:hypothetical protein
MASVPRYPFMRARLGILWRKYTQYKEMSQKADGMKICSIFFFPITCYNIQIQEISCVSSSTAPLFLVLYSWLQRQRRRLHVPLKHQLIFNGLHTVTSQNSPWTLQEPQTILLNTSLQTCWITSPVTLCSENITFLINGLVMVVHSTGHPDLQASGSSYTVNCAGTWKAWSVTAYNWKQMQCCNIWMLHQVQRTILRSNACSMFDSKMSHMHTEPEGNHFHLVLHNQEWNVILVHLFFWVELMWPTVSEDPFRAHDQIFLLPLFCRTICFALCLGAPSLTRGWVCNLWCNLSVVRVVEDS